MYIFSEHNNIQDAVDSSREQTKGLCNNNSPVMALAISTQCLELLLCDTTVVVVMISGENVIVKTSSGIQFGKHVKDSATSYGVDLLNESPHECAVPSVIGYRPFATVCFGKSAIISFRDRAGLLCIACKNKYDLLQLSLSNAE